MCGICGVYNVQSGARSRGYLDEACVARLLHDHLAGRTNYQAQLFTLASLELWFRIFIDSTCLQCPRSSLEELLEERVSLSAL
jgi:asparagine synthase (glutamine-hydrolysing)